jgi:tetratricopeptide (TPR) repeat protein
VRELKHGEIPAETLSSAVPRSDDVQESDNLASDSRYRLLQRRWFIPAATAAVLFLVGMMTNWAAAGISLALGPYQNWIWVLFIVSLLVAIIAAISEKNRKDKPSELLGGVTMVNANVVSSVADKPVVRIPEALNFLHEIPPPPSDFTGRGYELEELLASIEGGGITISGLQGMGGIGKTALALKLAERLKPRYPDAQFFLDLKGASAQPLTVAEAFAHVIRAYHPAVRLPDSERELRGLYLSVLDGQRALLLMDNAADAKQVEALIPPASCLLLVTSRQHFTLPGLTAKNLDTLSATDARNLLLTIAPRIGTYADEIAELCGYLPLALRLAAAVMVKYRNLSPADYVLRLRERQQRLQLINASLSVSYELLIEETRQRWRWLAVFPYTFAVDAAAAVWEVEVDQAKYILGELIATSMVEWNESSDRYRLHDLARLFAEAKLSAEERALAQKRFAMHYKDVLVAARNQYLEGGESLLHGLALFDLEWGNIDAGHAWVSAQADTADVDVVRLCMTYADAGAYVLSLRQHPREQIRWLEAALAAARQLKDRFSEGRLLGNLGLVFADLGDYRRAIGLNEQLLAIARELGDRRGEGNALHSLGYAYSALGDYPRAIEFNEQSLIIAREIGDRRSEAVALRYLGSEYAALGEYRRAIEFNEQSLVIAREIGDRRGEGNALGSLGSAYASLGETQRALEFNEQWLIIARELGDRRAEGEALFNVGLILNELGDRSKAIANAETALEILDKIESPRAESVREQLSRWRKLT